MRVEVRKREKLQAHVLTDEKISQPLRSHLLTSVFEDSSGVNGECPLEGRLQKSTRFKNNPVQYLSLAFFLPGDFR